MFSVLNRTLLRTQDLFSLFQIDICFGHKLFVPYSQSISTSDSTCLICISNRSLSTSDSSYFFCILNRSLPRIQDICSVFPNRLDSRYLFCIPQQTSTLDSRYLFVFPIHFYLGLKICVLYSQKISTSDSRCSFGGFNRSHLRTLDICSVVVFYFGL